MTVTLLLEVTFTVQVLAFVVSQPVQVPNVEPESAVAVNVTVVPVLYDAEHVLPQLILPSALVTLPEPLPDFVTVRVY
nr:hypothetical protein [Candidatus Magnetobacterium casensis]